MQSLQDFPPWEKLQVFWCNNNKIDDSFNFDDNSVLTIRDVKNNYLSFDIIDPSQYSNDVKFDVVNVKLGFVKQIKLNQRWKPASHD